MSDQRKNDARRDPAACIHLSLELAGEATTRALAGRLAAVARGGDVLALRGSLGVGKTTFARHFLRALGCREEVPSPTFTLAQIYAVGTGERALTVWHFDLYRIDTPADVFELGIEDAFAEGVSLIEWPEKMAALLPADALDLAFEFGDGEGVRGLCLSGRGDWPRRLAGLLPVDIGGDG